MSEHGSTVPCPRHPDILLHKWERCPIDRLYPWIPDWPPWVIVVLIGALVTTGVLSLCGIGVGVGMALNRQAASLEVADQPSVTVEPLHSVTPVIGVTSAPSQISTAAVLPTDTPTPFLTNTLSQRPFPTATPSQIPSSTKTVPPTTTRPPTATRTPTRPVTPTAAPLSCATVVTGRYFYLWAEYQDRLGCPLSATERGIQDAEQVFQNGHLFWRADIDRYYAIFDGGGATFGQWVTYRKQPGAIQNCPENAPSGLWKPVSGFGDIWCAIGGVNSGLGWATDREYGFQPAQGINIQDFDRGVIFQDSDGVQRELVYVLTPTGFYRVVP